MRISLEKMKFIILFVCFACLLGANRCDEEEEVSLFDQINSSPVLPTMIQYVVVPAVETHGSYYLGNQTRELVENVSRWQNTVQSWASQLSVLFQKITQIRLDSCARKLLCSLGKAKFQSLKEQKRSTGSRIIDVMNSIFRLPSIEQKLNFTYLEAREFGASGANCEEFPSASKCPIATKNFDQIFYLIKQLF